MRMRTVTTCTASVLVCGKYPSKSCHIKSINVKYVCHQVHSNFERFFGTLNDEQVILLKAHALATLGDAKTRFENRTMRQKIFVKFLLMLKAFLHQIQEL